MSEGVIAAGAVRRPRLVHPKPQAARPSVRISTPGSGFRNEFWFVLPSMRPLFVGGLYTYLLTLTEKEVVAALAS